MAAKVARARVDAVQEFKESFKDTVDYLFLMRDAVKEYKAYPSRRLTRPSIVTITTASFLANRPLLHLRIHLNSRGRN